MAHPPSFLDAVSKNIIESANSIDAHIDADSLIDRLTLDPSPTSTRSRNALSELKDLARRAPSAVVATERAVPTLARLVIRLTPGNGVVQEEDEWAEPLQDTLEALRYLIGDGRATDSKDDAVRMRARDVAELVVRHAENGKQLLRLLSLPDASTQHDAMALLQRIYLQMPRPIDDALLADPLAFNSLMHLLQNCQIDFVRNGCVSLLLLLTATNEEIQKIVVVNGAVESIFAILKEEDLSVGGKVARDLLQILKNLVGNATCQRYIRESECLASLVAALSAAVSGPSDDGGYVDGLGYVDAVGRPDLSEEVRWKCLTLMTDVALALVGGTVGGEESEANPEAAANQDALVRAGVLGLCGHLSDARVELPAKLKLVELLNAFAENRLAAQVLQSFKRGSPPICTVTLVLVQPGTPLPLRSAVGRFASRAIARHEDLQSFLCSSLSPQLELSDGELPPPGQQIVHLIQRVVTGHCEPERLWFAMHLVLGMLFTNPNVQSACVSMPVAVPDDAGPAETFLELMFRLFSSTANACSHAKLSADAEVDAERTPCTFVAALVSILKVLTYWFSSCTEALVPFATNPVMVPLMKQLTSADSVRDPFLRMQVEGLACLLMGICVKCTEREVDAGSLMALLGSSVGVEEYQSKVDRLWRSDCLQRPPRGVTDFRWYDGAFRAFYQAQQLSVQRRMVQLYVSGEVGISGAPLSEDITDHYKKLIRVQDAELNEVRKENEQLRKEVEAFMLRSVQASSVALLEKMDALQAENEVLHLEVGQLTQDLNHRDGELESCRLQFRSSVRDIEHQLESVAMGYEQVEQTSAGLHRENGELRASLAAEREWRAAQGSTATDGRLQVEQNLASAEKRLREQHEELSDLQDLLNRVATACPGANVYVAPLNSVPTG